LFSRAEKELNDLILDVQREQMIAGGAQRRRGGHGSRRVVVLARGVDHGRNGEVQRGMGRSPVQTDSLNRVMLAELATHLQLEAMLGERLSRAIPREARYL